MENDVYDGQSVSESLWQNLTVEMDSSSLGEMQRLLVETNRTYEEIMEANTEEIITVNEAIREEDNYANEVVITDVSQNIISLNEVVISEVTDENANVIEAVTDEIESSVYMGDTVEIINVNEVVTADVTKNITSMNEEVISAVTRDKADIIQERIEVVTDETIVGNTVESLPEKDPCIKMRHFLSEETYCFVQELIEAIEENQYEDKENSCERKRLKINYPRPCIFYFTDMHKYYALTYVNSKEEDFISVIKEYTPTDCICVFETCKERFIERYKPKTFTGIGFVRFCAAIAYLGFHCSTRGLDPSAKSKATNYICSLLYDVIQQNLLNQVRIL